MEKLYWNETVITRDLVAERIQDIYGDADKNKEFCEANQIKDEKERIEALEDFYRATLWSICGNFTFHDKLRESAEDLAERTYRDEKTILESCDCLKAVAEGLLPEWIPDSFEDLGGIEALKKKGVEVRKELGKYFWCVYLLEVSASHSKEKPENFSDLELGFLEQMGMIAWGI